MDYTEKAIEILKGCYKTVSMCSTSNDCEEHNKAINLSINALEKQIPSKTIPWDGHSNSGVCPNCYENISKHDYCPLCGQKLDWKG